MFAQTLKELGEIARQLGFRQVRPKEVTAMWGLPSDCKVSVAYKNEDVFFAVIKFKSKSTVAAIYDMRNAPKIRIRDAGGNTWRVFNAYSSYFQFTNGFHLILPFLAYATVHFPASKFNITADPAEFYPPIYLVIVSKNRKYRIPLYNKRGRLVKSWRRKFNEVKAMCACDEV